MSIDRSRKILRYVWLSAAHSIVSSNLDNVSGL